MLAAMDTAIPMPNVCLYDAMRLTVPLSADSPSLDGKNDDLPGHQRSD